LFGAATNNNNAFLGNQNSNFQNAGVFGGNINQPGGTGIFGGASNTTFGNTSNQNTGLFGATTNQPSNAGLFNSFAPNNNPTNNNPLFGGNTNATTNAFNPNPTTSPFNTNPTSAFNTVSPFGTSNKLGGTSWGVPTTLTSQPSTTGGQTLIQPVRSKNSKLDAKHLVKCIAVLDQFQGVSK
jgi:hypothetical protein